MNLYVVLRDQCELMIPDNLVGLHNQEEQLRIKSLEIIAGDDKLQKHIAAVELVMDLADVLRQLDSSDEDLKVIQLLGMRVFNAFGSSLKLALSGYGQNSALILRDVLETVFLIDLFGSNKSLIERWRVADKKSRRAEFSPLKVREALDQRDGFTTKKRYAMYEMFSELAGHPSMKSAWMMRPVKNGDAVIGPFVEQTMVQAVLSEMGRLAIQFGEKIEVFFPRDWEAGLSARLAFAKMKRDWIIAFYGKNDLKAPPD